MKVRHEALLNFASYAASRTAALIVFGFTVPLSLHALGTARYAVLATVVLALGLVPMLDAGVSYALTYRFSRQALRGTERARRMLAEHGPFYLGVAALLAAGFCIGLPAAIDTGRGDVTDIVPVAVAGAFAIFFSTGSAVGRAVLIALKRMHQLNWLDMGTDLLRGFALLAGAWWLQSLVWAVALTACAYCVRWCAVLVICRNLVPQRSGIRTLRWRSLRATLGIGAPFALSTTAAVAWGLLDKAMVARSFSLAELAPYSLAYDLVTKGWLVIWAVTGAVSPILMRWRHEREHGKIARALRYSWVVVGVLVALTYVPLNLLELPVLGWWVGPPMAQAARQYIALLSIAGALYFAVSTMQTFYLFCGRPGIVGRSYLIGFCAYLPTLYYGLQRWQIAGAAIAHIVLWSVVALVMGLSLRSVTGAPVRATSEPEPVL